jgi:hypothetical protein
MAGVPAPMVLAGFASLGLSAARQLTQTLMKLVSSSYEMSKVVADRCFHLDSIRTEINVCDRQMTPFFEIEDLKSLELGAIQEFPALTFDRWQIS